MKLGDIQDSKSIVVPNEDGVKLYLKALPSYEEGMSKDNRAYSKIQFVFATVNNEYFEPGLMNPYEFEPNKYKRGASQIQSNKKSDAEEAKYYRTVIGNFSRLKHIFGCFMTAENYKILEDIDVDNLKEFLEVVESLYAPDIFETEFTAMVGYGKTGYLQFPAVGDCLSSKYKHKTLMFDPKSRLTLRKLGATPDSEGDGISSSRGNSYNTNEI